jgi:hypothetical protein
MSISREYFLRWLFLNSSAHHLALTFYPTVLRSLDKITPYNGYPDLPKAGH